MKWIIRGVILLLIFGYSSPPPKKKQLKTSPSRAGLLNLRPINHCIVSLYSKRNLKTRIGLGKWIYFRSVQTTGRKKLISFQHVCDSLIIYTNPWAREREKKRHTHADLAERQVNWSFPDRTGTESQGACLVSSLSRLPPLSVQGSVIFYAAMLLHPSAPSLPLSIPRSSRSWDVMSSIIELYRYQK